MATITTNIVREFSDLDLNFTIHTIRKDINRVTGDRAVIASIKNLVLTNHYERPFQPEVGSNVRRLLFENMDNLTAASIESQILQTINNFEPRAKVSRITAYADFDKNGFSVQLEFFIVNKTDPIIINFFLERIR